MYNNTKIPENQSELKTDDIYAEDDLELKKKE